MYLMEDVKLYFINILGPRKNGHHFADDIFKCIFVIEKD